MCAYVRESLPVRNFSNSYLSECFTLEVTISNWKAYVVTLYRSPSQISDEFLSFISKLEKLLTNINSFDPHFVILLADFNVKSKLWWINDTTAEGTVLENLTFLKLYFVILTWKLSIHHLTLVKSGIMERHKLI